jgi:hypothetical protein
MFISSKCFNFCVKLQKNIGNYWSKCRFFNTMDIIYFKLAFDKFDCVKYDSKDPSRTVLPVFVKKYCKCKVSLL